jgi:hypothetical protein
MDLLDGNTNTENTLTKQTIESDNKTENLDEVEEITGESYQLLHPMIAPHPINNPMIKVKTKLNTIAPHAVELINKMEALDKAQADEMRKVRDIGKATKPLIAEIERLKSNAHDGALEDKIKEIKEYSDTMESSDNPLDKNTRLGATIEDGMVKFTTIPSKLRDNIPLDESREKSSMVNMLKNAMNISYSAATTTNEFLFTDDTDTLSGDNILVESDETITHKKRTRKPSSKTINPTKSKRKSNKNK